MSVFKFCIDVECIFDFRLASIATYSDTAYKTCFLDDVERYITRDHDRFHEWDSAVDKTHFLTHYQNRV